MSEETTTMPAVRQPMQVGERGVQITNTEEMLRFAGTMLASKLVPASFKTAQEVVIAMQMVKEVGLPMATGINKAAVINGRACLWGEAIRALVMGSGCVKTYSERIEGEGDGRVCIIRCERNDIAGEIEIRFGVQHAKDAGLWKKAGPWTQYPEDMLSHKAFSRLSKRLFSDKLMGIDMVEDVRDVPQFSHQSRVVNPDNDPLLAGNPAESN